LFGTLAKEAEHVRHYAAGRFGLLNSGDPAGRFCEAVGEAQLGNLFEVP
jgi:hypothetical protein